MQPKMGGKSHLKLNIGERPIANKYREGKMKRTLKREWNSTWNCWKGNVWNQSCGRVISLAFRPCALSRLAGQRQFQLPDKAQGNVTPSGVLSPGQYGGRDWGLQPMPSRLGNPSLMLYPDVDSLLTMFDVWVTRWPTTHRLGSLTKWFQMTRLETRTKESNIYASVWVANPCA